jgi:hypothetical protein
MIAIPLSEGQSAPWDGQLISKDLAISLSVRANTCDRLMGIEASHTKKRADREIQHISELREIDKQLYLSNEKILRDAAKRPWWEHPLIVAAITFAGTTGVFWTAGQVFR